MKVITLFNTLTVRKQVPKENILHSKGKFIILFTLQSDHSLLIFLCNAFLVRFDDDSTDCWEDARVPSLTRPDGKFGDYNCDSSYELISSVLQFMKAKMGDNIDFILWTGYVLHSTYFLRISTWYDTQQIIMITMIIMQHLTS